MIDKSETIFVERYLTCIFQSLGKMIEISFKNGETGVGIFCGLNPESRCFLVRNLCRQNSEIQERKKEIKFEEVLFFAIKDDNIHKVEEYRLKVKNNIAITKSKSTKEDSYFYKQKDLLLNEKPKGIQNDIFRTDVEISKKTSELKDFEKKKPEGSQKVFKRFQSEHVKHELLENEKLEGFDQFKANHKHFGIDSHFNESDYTTSLNMKDLSKEQILKADRLAKEIINSTHGEFDQSRHLLEERNLIDLKDNDNEESLYSAVVREKEIVVNTRPKPKFVLRETKPINRESTKNLISRNYMKNNIQLKPTSGQDSVLISQIGQQPTQGYFQMPSQNPYIEMPYQNFQYAPQQMAYYVAPPMYPYGAIPNPYHGLNQYANHGPR